jgi:hypothetical protein
MRSVRMGTTMNKLLVAAAALVAVAVVPANAQKFDFSPVKPQAITKAKIKTDLLGFRIEMTRQEATDQLKTLGCKKVTDEYAGALNAIGCALPAGDRHVS